MCVYVCVWPPVERGYPLTRYQSQGEFTPPNACDVIPPLDSAHQPLPGEMLADGCPLGIVYGTATFSSRLLESCPACHSVTLRFRLGHLPFLPFQISEESDTRSQCNYAQKTPILTQTKSSKAFETIIAKQWLGVKVANLRTGDAARKQVPVLYGNDRPALARHKFWHDFILSRVVGMEKYRCFSWITRENRCSLSMRNAKDRRQSGIVLSPPDRSFEPRTSAT